MTSRLYRHWRHISVSIYINRLAIGKLHITLDNRGESPYGCWQTVWESFQRNNFGLAGDFEELVDRGVG
jgi:hypothetical protein